MALRYKLLKREGPGMGGDGQNQRNANNRIHDEMNVNDLVSEIAKSIDLAELDIKEVIITLENVIYKALSEGTIVRLDKLGTLYPSINSAPLPPVEDFSPEKKNGQRDKG